MERVYHTDWGRETSNSLLGHSGVTACAWSCTNLLAFTCEKQVNGFLEKYLHILDPNQPWDVYSIALKTVSIVSIQWNQTGNKLLCIESNGVCSVWATVSHLMNVWTKKHNLASDLHEENIVATSWLHNGRKVVFHVDKLESANEKITRVTCRPCVTQLGGQPMEGYVAVSGSGCVYVKVISQEEATTAFAKASLGHYGNLVLADIAFGNQGNVVIMSTDCDVNNAVFFWTLDLKFSDETGKLSIEVDVLPNIVLKCTSDPVCKYDHVTHLKFVSHENPDHILVCVSGTSGSMIETWLNKKEAQPNLHSSLMSSGSPEKMSRWHHVKRSQHLTTILGITIPPLPTSTATTKSAGDLRFFCGTGIAVALADNTVHILHRLTLATIMTHKIHFGVEDPELKSGVLKRSRTAECNLNVRHIEFSTTSCSLVVFDNHAGMSVFRIAPWLNSSGVAGGPLAFRHIVHLLHFCMVMGFEWWDVLLHVQANIVDPVCERLVGEYKELSSPLQQMLQSRILALRLTIYQTVGNSNAVDCQLRLFLEAIRVVFRSLLRPPHDSSEEQSPADKIHEACKSSYETDITKLQQCVDTDAQVLQSLQQLIQWVADVTMYLIAIVPQVSVPNTPGRSLLQDSAWLSTLRELLVIIQTWKLLKSACSPVFTCLDDQIDSLPHIFKLLTDIWHAVSTNETMNHFPESVVDDCCLLPNQILIPSLDVIQPVDGVAQRLNVIPPPYSFEYGKRPYKVELPDRFANQHFVRPSLGKIDNLRRVHLGVSPVAPLRQCARCGIFSLLSSPPSSALGFWDQRFVKLCICGGRWRKANSQTIIRK